MKTTNIAIKNLIRKKLKNLLESNVPAGADSDPSAPWNEPLNPEITYTTDYVKDKFYVNVDNGNTYDVDFLDVLEMYWKAHPFSYEEHEEMFPERDETVDRRIIQMLTNKGYDFTDYLYDIGERRDLLSSY